MKAKEMRVTYIIKTRYTTKRCIDMMSWDEYLDLVLDEDVIIKRKVWL